MSRMTRILEQLVMALLFAMFAMIVILVILRYLFSTTIIGGNEATVIAFVYTTAIGAAISISRDEHISIRYFTDKLSPQTQLTLSQVQLVLVAVLNLAIAAYAWAWIGRTGGFLMPALGLPQMVAQISVPLGAVLSVLYCLVRMLENRQLRESPDQ
jgi:TRAP-type C4-dicarboxylate transport system permease small subunit